MNPKRIISSLEEKKLDLSIEEFLVLYAKFEEPTLLRSWKPYKAYQALQDKGLLTASSSVTSLAKSIFEEEDVDAEFEEFWKSYPASDAHGRFPLSRGMRVNKPKTKAQWKKIIKSGVTNKQLIEALNRAVETKIKRSTTRNELSLLPNPYKWLASEEYLVWMEDKGNSTLNKNLANLE